MEVNSNIQAYLLGNTDLLARTVLFSSIAEKPRGMDRMKTALSKCRIDDDECYHSIAHEL